MTGYSYDEVDALAERYSPDFSPDDGLTERVFVLLLDVADRYLALLEGAASDDPAPFFAGSTPMTALINGLAENLDIRRGNL